jgi:DNA-binding transcriptional LysR family regulator
MKSTTLQASRVTLPKIALAYFAEVADSGSVRSAADRLYVAPSAVSRQISKLEELLGVTLFDRRAGGMHLTEAGRLLHEHTSRSERDLKRTVAAMEDLHGLGGGEIEIATVEGMIEDFVPEAISAFRIRHPAIRFNVRVASALHVLEAVTNDEVDIGIALNVPKRREIVVMKSMPQPIRLYCNPDNPLARARKLSLETFDQTNLALQETSFWIRRVVDDAFGAHGLTAKPAIVTNSLLLLKSLVRNGPTVTFLPNFAARAEVKRGELIEVRVEDPLLSAAHLDIYVHATRRLSAAANEFLKLLQLHLGRSRA